MNLDINKHIINKTTKCMYDFSCLSGKKECLCAIENNRPAGNICFVNPENNHYCDYKIPFGYSYICTCPTRKEIHNRYHI